MKLLISGGRTGGHLIPGIALYEEFTARGCDCVYVMSEFDLKYPVVSKIQPEKRITLPVTSISRKLSLKTPIYVWRIFKSFLGVFGRIRKENPDAVVITGGYISNPVACSALLLGKPLYIAEQNSCAGITNRFYAKFAKKIFTSFPVTKHIPAKKSILTGNPSLSSRKTTAAEAKAFFKVDPSRPCVGVTGGSQGAKTLNNAVLDILPELSEKGISVIWSLGSVDYDRFEKDGTLERIEDRYPGVKVFRFIERMDHFYGACSVVITRAGATTIGELIQTATPSILVPIPRSPDNHQYWNARFLSDRKAGILLEESVLNAENLLAQIETLLSQWKARSDYAAAIQAEIYPQPPAKRISAFVLKLPE